MLPQRGPRNEAAGTAGHAPRHVVGFNDDVVGLMQLSDFFIGKPGPGSLSEAVQQGLPVIVVRNAWTMPQERYNAQWVRENRVGIVLRGFRTIGDAVTDLTGRLDEFRGHVRAIENRAVIEIPDILAGILAGPAAHPDAQREPDAATAPG